MEVDKSKSSDCQFTTILTSLLLLLLAAASLILETAKCKPLMKI